MECAFDIFTAKWHIFTTSIQLKQEAVNEVVKACIVLHNFVLTKEPLLMAKQGLEMTLPSIAMSSVRSTSAVNQTGLLNILSHALAG